MARDVSTDSFADDFCMSIVYVSMETGEDIESILHWNIKKYNAVIKYIGKINKIKSGKNPTPGVTRVLG